MARVMVGVMTRNRVAWAREAVHSVLAQSEGDFRLVVSENPTTPQAAAEMREFVASLGDPRVSYVLQAVDGGEYGQGRYLFGQCEEPCFCFLHDDDRMAPGYLRAALAALDADPQAVLFTSGQTLIDAEGQALPRMTRDYACWQGRDRFQAGRIERPLDVLLSHGFFPISGTVFRSAPVRRQGLVDPDLGGIYPFEFNVMLRALEHGGVAQYTPEPLLEYRWHAQSMRQADGSSLTGYMVRDLVRLLERRRFTGHTELLRRRLLAYNLRNLGLIDLVAGRRSQAHDTLMRACRLHARALGLWVYWAAGWLAPRWLARRYARRVNLAAPSPSWAKAIPVTE